jgi:anti-anti-sigma factor
MVRGTMGPLSVSVSLEGTEAKPYVLLTLAGEADTNTRDHLRQVLLAQAVAGRRLVVDMSRVSFMDSSCTQVLLGATRMLTRQGGTLGLVAPQRVVARMLRLAGVDKLIPVHGSMAEALAG